MITKVLTVLAMAMGVSSLPLEMDSLLTVRMPTGSSSGALNMNIYAPVIIEEWSVCKTQGCTTPVSLAQSWNLPQVSTSSNPACTNFIGEGKLQFGLPDLQGAWYICRDVSVGQNSSARPAPVVVSHITESGNWEVFQRGGVPFPPGTSLGQLTGRIDQSPPLPNNTLYALGGANGRFGNNYFVIQQDGQQENVTIPANIFEMTLLNDEFNLLAQPPVNTGGTSPSEIPNTYMMTWDANGNGPTYTNTGWRISSALSLSESPTVAWFTTEIPRPSLVRLDLTTGVNQTFPMPPVVRVGTMPSVPWTLHTAWYSPSAVFSLFFGNGTHILELKPFQQSIPGAAFSNVLVAPQGWRYTSVLARRLPNPYPTPVPPSPSPSQTPSNSPTPSSSQTPTNSPTPSPSQSPSNSPTPSSSQTPSNSPTPSSSVTSTPTVSPTSSPSLTASPLSNNGTGTNTTNSTNTTGGLEDLSGAYVPTSQNEEPILSVGSSIGVAFGLVGTLALIGLVATNGKVQRYFIGKFGIRSTPKPPPPSMQRKRSSPLGDAVVEINNNPALILQATNEQRMNQYKQQYGAHSAVKKQNIHVKKQFQPMNTTRADM